MGCDDAVFVILVFDDGNVVVMVVGKEFCGLVGEGMVYLEVELALGGEYVVALEGDGAVVDEGVAVGDEEGEVGLVVEDVGVHVGGFALEDVGGVADDDVCVGEGLCGVEYVGLNEVYVCMVCGGVGAGCGDGLGGDVDGGEVVVVVGEGDGDAACACADVEDVAGGGGAAK